ncbi:hypothetical protein GF314_10590 [bacterium]|nr:hypothetical protein [bacterium]
MGTTTAIDATVPGLGALAGEMVLAITVVVGLLVGPARPRAARLVATAGLAITLGLVLAGGDGRDPLGLGPHLTSDAATISARLTLLVLGLVTVMALAPGRGARAPLVVLSALGLIVVSAAASLVGLLLGLVLALLAAIRLGQQEVGPQRVGEPVASLRLTVAGFGIVAVAGILWCGLGGSMAWSEVRDGLAARPVLPPIAVPLILGLLLLGLLLGLLAPARVAPARGPVAAWLVVGPVAALAVLPHHLLLPMPPVPTLASVPQVMLVLGALLAIGSLTAALARGGALVDPPDGQTLARRLQTAAPGQLGLVWLGMAVLVPDDALRAATTGALVLAMAHLAAVSLATAAGRGLGDRLALTLLLLILAGVPPLTGWRPRFGLVDGLLAGEAYLACGLAVVATLLGFVVYLQPLIGLWRRPAAAFAPSSGATVLPLAGRLAIWVVLLLLLGLGLRGLVAWPMVG